MRRVHAIVVGTNEGRWLRASLGSLLQGVTRDHELVVTYVDNGSTDGSVELVRSALPAVEVIENRRNLGFARANNIGIGKALADGADFVFLVNPDTRTPRSLVHDLVEFMEAHEQYAIVGPLQREYASIDDPNLETPLNEWSETALAQGEAHGFFHWCPDRPSTAGPLEGRAPETLEHAYVQGAALFARSTVLRDIGLLRPEYHTFYEEVDLCRRARYTGRRVALLLGLSIQHKGGGGSAFSPYRSYHMVRNKYYFLWSDPEWHFPEALSLTLRWARYDLRSATRKPRDAWLPLTVGICARAALWLTLHTPHAIARRCQAAWLIRRHR